MRPLHRRAAWMVLVAGLWLGFPLAACCDAAPYPQGTCEAAWGPYRPWLYRPRWIYPYRYYPLRWSYSLYSPYYFYSPYRWYAGPVWGYVGWPGYGGGLLWYGPGTWSSAAVPYLGGWAAYAPGPWDGCACGGLGGPLPYDTGPYLGWPYDAGCSFRIPCWEWVGAWGVGGVDSLCPPGCRDATGALHW